MSLREREIERFPKYISKQATYVTQHARVSLRLSILWVLIQYVIAMLYCCSGNILCAKARAITAVLCSRTDDHTRHSSQSHVS